MNVNKFHFLPQLQLGKTNVKVPLATLKNKNGEWKKSLGFSRSSQQTFRLILSSFADAQYMNYKNNQHPALKFLSTNSFFTSPA